MFKNGTKQYQNSITLSTFFDDTETASEIQVPLSPSTSALSWCFNIEQAKHTKQHIYIYIYIYIYIIYYKYFEQLEKGITSKNKIFPN